MVQYTADVVRNTASTALWYCQEGLKCWQRCPKYSECGLEYCKCYPKHSQNVPDSSKVIQNAATQDWQYSGQHCQCLAT